MAQLKHRRSENVSGDLYVDRTCIDCDTCRWMAPEMFTQMDEQSAVYHQPATEGERIRALQALLACPTSSIGTVDPPNDIKAAQDTFPIPIHDTVYHCGFHSKSSYGAASYLILRPEGNVLVDSPRFAPPLVKRLEELGGIRYLYLTHRDDVADHEKFRSHFGCERILHEDDISKDTQGIERQLTGRDPVQLAPDLLIIPVPGHTKGHTVLLYRQQILFSGDHLAWSDQRGHLTAFGDACWYSWPEQVQSMMQLADYSFEWVLPGHGRRYHADAATMKQEMAHCIAWMQSPESQLSED
ncbi:MAG: MBL fold metallo-hydrolase [Cyanophyceae cyanobacterium]|jgi:glyoxylase-like metal-dependent hydrolase (beta-lactamase superfamily II)/ferredoxin